MVRSHLAAALVLLASLVAGLEVPVEHSVNGRDWLPAGSITVDAKDLAVRQHQSSCWLASTQDRGSQGEAALKSHAAGRLLAEGVTSSAVQPHHIPGR